MYIDMKTNKRLLSLDILRGMTVAGMIMVNNGYDQPFEILTHAKWNGMTLCDLVFPFFLFIVGVSIHLSFSKFGFRPTRSLVTKILQRSFFLFVIGVAINWFDHAAWGDWNCFAHLRVWAVLQRIALSYCLASLLVLFVNHKWICAIIACLLIIYSIVLLAGNGYSEDSSNILARVDQFLLGTSHLYTKSPVDPEGLLGTVPSVAHVLIGFFCGGLLQKNSDKVVKARALLFVAVVLLFLGFLLSFSLPLNKRVWSPSYVLVTCGIASMLLSVLMYIVDIRGYKRWTTFFHVFGVNSLALYVASEVFSICFGAWGISEVVFSAISSAVVHPQFSSLCYAISFVFFNFLFGYILYRCRVFIKL